MSEVKHSQLPWMVSEAFGNSIVENEDVAVARMTGTPEEIEANATFIVKACNAHAELVDALRKCKAAVENVNLPPSARMELVRDYSTPILAKIESQMP